MGDPSWETGAQRASRSLLVLLRSRGLRVFLGVVLVASALLVAGVVWLWSRALSPECVVLQRAELSLEEMGAVKRRVEALRREPTRRLWLSGREASFILRETLDYPVWVEIEGEEVRLQLALPERGRCYNVDFLGRIDVEEGVARVRPRRLRVGELDLSPITSGREFQVRPRQLGPAAKLLDRTTELHVRGGSLEVQVDGPEAFR